MAKKSRRNGKAKPRRMNGTIIAMTRRYATQQTTHKHRCERRAKDARNHWSKEWE